MLRKFKQIYLIYAIILMIFSTIGCDEKSWDWRLSVNSKWGRLPGCTRITFPPGFRRISLLNKLIVDLT